MMTTQTQPQVTDIPSLEDLIARVKQAQEAYATYTQEQVDHIFKQVAIAANAERIPLAKQAVAETGMGVIEDKVIKNHFASEYIYNKYKQEKTCGVVSADAHYGIQKVAEPLGIVAGIIPTTNPTSTAILRRCSVSRPATPLFFLPILGPSTVRCEPLKLFVMLL